MIQEGLKSQSLKRNGDELLMYVAAAFLSSHGRMAYSANVPVRVRRAKGRLTAVIDDLQHPRDLSALKVGCAREPRKVAW